MTPEQIAAGQEYWCGTCGIGIESFADWNANGGDCPNCREWWDEQGPNIARLSEVAALLETMVERTDDE